MHDHEPDGGRTAYVEQRLLPHLPPGPGARILDLGCGDGFIGATLLADCGFHSVTIHEDRPVVHGFLSGLRGLLWRPLRLAILLWGSVELPCGIDAPVSRNHLAVARRATETHDS